MTPLALALLLAAGPAAAPTQVRLGWRGPADSTITVRWRSADPTGAVELGTGTSYGRRLDSASEPRAEGFEHVAEITGLSPGTAYHYRCGGPGGFSEDATFVTAPRPGTPFRFAAWGDNRSHLEARARVRDAILARQPAFSIAVGDYTDDGGDPAAWDRWLEDLSPLLRLSPLAPALGNHEGDGALFFRLFATPERPPVEGIPGSACYSFDYGSVHFAALSTEAGFGEAQRAWLEADLARARAQAGTKWIVAYGHRPPYSSGRHGSDLRVRALFEPVFERYRVAVAFWGHDHDYERTRPMRGTVHVVTGGGGVWLGQVGQSDFTAFSRSTYQFVEVAVTDEALEIAAHGVPGGVFDRVTVPPPPAPPSGDAGAGRLFLGAGLAAAALLLLAALRARRRLPR